MLVFKSEKEVTVTATISEHPMTLPLTQLPCALMFHTVK